MGKGTGSLGKRRNNTHALRAVRPPQLSHSEESCNNWSVEAIWRKTTGTGRMRYLRNVAVRFKSNFREGTLVVPRKNRRL